MEEDDSADSACGVVSPFINNVSINPPLKYPFQSSDYNNLLPILAAITSTKVSASVSGKSISLHY